ncbi:MAG TPA: EamA family transporter, partial [Gammaproteobacteria bacterium]|nr:EamA family transporter [Gammaproteobacteria bacterium]
MSAEVSKAPSRLALASAFAIVYVVWGSTFLAILFAIQSLPPFLMASVRFLVAGALLYAWSRFVSGAAAPSRAEWQSSAAVGALLLLGGNGLLVWSEQRIPSGVAALLVGTVPCFMALIDWWRPGGTRPSRFVTAGLVLGLLGLAWLVGPDALMGGGRADLVGATVVVLGSFSWAAGSIYSRHVARPASPFLSTAMQMLAGGAALLVLSVSLGELRLFDVHAVTLRSALGLLYLIVLGSLVAFSAYVWLLRVSTPAKVSTYAYVNPVVAVL